MSGDLFLLPVGGASFLNHADLSMGNRVFFFIVEHLIMLLYCGDMARWYRWSWWCIVGDFPEEDVCEWLECGLCIPAVFFRKLVQAPAVP